MMNQHQAKGSGVADAKENRNQRRDMLLRMGFDAHDIDATLDKLWSGTRRNKTKDTAVKSTTTDSSIQPKGIPLQARQQHQEEVTPRHDNAKQYNRMDSNQSEISGSDQKCPAMNAMQPKHLHYPGRAMSKGVGGTSPLVAPNHVGSCSQESCTVSNKQEWFIPHESNERIRPGAVRVSGLGHNDEESNDSVNEAEDFEPPRHGTVSGTTSGDLEAGDYYSGNSELVVAHTVAPEPRLDHDEPILAELVKPSQTTIQQSKENKEEAPLIRRNPILLVTLFLTMILLVSGAVTGTLIAIDSMQSDEGQDIVDGNETTPSGDVTTTRPLPPATTMTGAPATTTKGPPPTTEPPATTTPTMGLPPMTTTTTGPPPTTTTTTEPPKTTTTITGPPPTTSPPPTTTGPPPTTTTTSTTTGPPPTTTTTKTTTGPPPTTTTTSTTGPPPTTTTASTTGPPPTTTTTSTTGPPPPITTTTGLPPTTTTTTGPPPTTTATTGPPPTTTTTTGPPPTTTTTTGPPPPTTTTGSPPTTTTTTGPPPTKSTTTGPPPTTTGPPPTTTMTTGPQQMTPTTKSTLEHDPILHNVTFRELVTRNDKGSR